MTDIDFGVHFDTDPNTNRLLKPETKEFLSTFRNSRDFELGYNGNLSLVGDISRYNPVGIARALWSRAFVDRLFGLETVEEADKLLDPWMEWNKLYRKNWEDFYKPGLGEKFDARHNEYQERADNIPIPREILQYSGDIDEASLHRLAQSQIFGLTRIVRESIDVLEGLPRPISAENVFRVQRVTGQPYWPVGGLQEAVKPNIRQTLIDGKPYVLLFPAEQGMDDLLVEDDASEVDWKRWNSLELGLHVRNAQQENNEAYDKSWSEGGSIVGFNLEGAGDLMLYQPGIKNVVVYVREDNNGFLRYPLLRQIALDTETADIHYYTDIPFTRATTPVTVINFQEGNVKETELPNEEAADYISNEIRELDNNKDGSGE